MLYDKRWDKPEVKADPFSLDSLIAWLEKQPGDETYCYIESGECLLTQYFTASGYNNVYMFTTGFWHGQDQIPGHAGRDEAIEMGRYTPLPAGFDRIAHARPHTFGAALVRARKASCPQESGHE